MNSFTVTLTLGDIANGRVAKTLVLLLLLTYCLSLSAFSRWNTYTNTNHVTDFILTQDKGYSASWGGVTVYDRHQNNIDNQADLTFSHTLTSVDGLTSNDVRTIAYEPTSSDLWIGTYNNGITIIKSTGNQILNVGSGLPSNRVRRILVDQAYIFVATDAGISQFYYLPGVSFPLLLHQYNTQNTQNGLNSNDVRDIAINSNGWLFCGTDEGISYIHKDSLDVTTAWHNWDHSNSPLTSDPILTISVNNNLIAANTYMTVHTATLTDAPPLWHTWSVNDALADSVFSVCLSPDNELYFSYGIWNEDTMSLRRKKTRSYGIIYPDENVLLSSHTENISNRDSNDKSIYRFVITEGLKIFCTWGDGIVAQNGYNQFQLENNCIGFQTISEIATDHNNRLWFVGGWIGGGMTRKGTRGVSSLTDGYWQTYTSKSSPLTSDNILNVAVDKNNKKWFGSWDANPATYGWHPGVNVFDDEADAWQWYTNDGVRNWLPDTNSWSDFIIGSPKLYNNTISEICVDKHGNILVNSSGSGIAAFDKDYEFIRYIQLPSNFTEFQQVVSIYHSGTKYFFGTNNDYGLVIWNDADLPDATGAHWLTPPSGMAELNHSIIYGVVTLTNQFGEEQNWIATSAGLIMWNGTDWYKYDTDIKARIWKNNGWSQSLTDGAIWYYEDEERIFGSVRTSPTAILLDPFNRIWIGSQDYGFSMYDPDTEKFTNYFKANSPLLSNFITCFGYDPIEGNLLIGTPDGLNTLEIGIETKTETKLQSVKAFPNPFYPNKDGVVRIVNIPSQSMPKGKNRCKIFDVSGALIVELPENEFAQFAWNGRNSGGSKCSSGIYYFAVSSSDGSTQRGKIALIQQ